MNESSPELQPCPFCAWREIYIEPEERGSGGQWVLPLHVGCCLCGVNIMCVDAETKEDAASVWNRRISTSSCPHEEVPVDRSLLEVAISEIREWKVNKGGDDQVLLNLEAGLRKHDENMGRASNG